MGINNFVTRYISDRIQEVAGGNGSRSEDRGDALDQIRKLGELRDAGLVTAEEFELKKRELLDRV